ncbi:MAG: hypothetical protein D6806_09850 [Deltaproteobacteria bacterium]|nr:MAG: hypothetical protein D6806_09850 [Deltaproteobacteria bacterium]
MSGLSALLLLAGLLTGARTTRWLEDALYQDEIVYAATTPYQRIVITRWRNDIRLFIDGNIQFSSADEFRYHEALVHPAMSLVPGARRILLLGGGDGLAAREVLKYGTVRRIDLVDLDPVMTGLFSKQPELVALNEGSLLDERLAVHNEDAWKFLERANGAWDVVLIDLPDPNNESLARLYTRSFYRLVFKHLSQRGLMVTQATSPFYATDAFWCIYNTVAATRYGPDGARPHVAAYHVDVPSFGDWGFVMAAKFPIGPERISVKVPTRFLTDEVAKALFVFSPDIAHRPTAVNRLDEPVLLRLYESGFRRYND